MLFATVLTLASASLHAGWNLVVKTSVDRDVAVWGGFLASGLLVIPFILIAGWPDRSSWWQLGTSSVVHVVYVAALAAAYRHADFSLSYPIARGLGALGAAIGGWLIYSDGLSTGGWLGAAMVAVGLLALAGPTRTSAPIQWAVVTGLAIATYTVIDASGARRAEGADYAFALGLTAAIVISVAFAVAGRGPALVAAVPTEWGRFLLTGAAGTAAYTLVLVAIRHAPVGYVATLRETSVVLGAAAGWLILRERAGRRRLVAASVVAVGLAVLVAFG